ncbi:SDR family oxidoreductase [Paraburkholderia sp. EG287B]|uniref:SDR family oxidoreductase n=1 Tax=Paraburkholderia sp. EG287B TaxID=3237010 RepID=UPI0034D2024F
MDLGLRGKRALVLGGSTGLGFGAGKALAGEGATVALVARTGQRLDAAAKSLGSHAMACDLSSPPEVEVLPHAAMSAMGHVDVVVLNGAGPPPLDASDFSAAVWRSQFETMLVSSISIAGALIPSMRDRRFGRIILIASTSIVEPIPGLVLSNALRAGLHGWAKTLAGEVACDGITVNTVMPGRIATDRTQGLDEAEAKRTGRNVERIAAASQAEIPVRRYGTADELGAVVAFLASERASYVNGARIAVDGGLLRN